MSSTIASESSITRRPTGSRAPSTAMQPTTNAMSVAMGMPQPRAAGSPHWSARYRPAGTTMPPSAAATGRAARRASRSSPMTSSRFTSSPTTKKKTAINPSLIQWRSEWLIWKEPTPTVSVVFQKPRNGSDQGELASASAAAVKARSTAPPAASTCRNAASGRLTRWMRPSGRRTRVSRAGWSEPAIAEGV